MGMEMWLASLIFAGGVVLFIGSGLWIGAALGVVGILGLLIHSGTAPLPIIANVGWDVLNSYVLSCFPGFILMGDLILRTGMSTRFYKALMTWIQRLPGGLTQTNIVGCSIFAAISGSSMVTAAAIGNVAIPEMRKRGYANELILGSLAAGGTLGILIPPSIPMIVYGAMVDASIGKLFIGGIIPGIILAGIFMFYIGSRAIIQPALVPERERSSWKERLVALKDVVPIVSLLIFILGGIYLGLVTPTEAAAMGAVGALILSFLYRGFSWKMFNESLLTAVRTTCMVAFILFGAQIMSFALVNGDVPRQLAAMLVSMGLSQYTILIIVFVLYAILGCFIEPIAMVLLTLPIVYPIMIGIGFHPVWFGVFLVMVIELGLLTPPVGMNVYVIKGIAGVSLGEVFKATIPYWFAIIGVLVLITVFPDLVLWLPGLMIGK
ncbi:TRAP transporter large permease [Chloroflexota bacterium]